MEKSINMTVFSSSCANVADQRFSMFHWFFFFSLFVIVIHHILASIPKLNQQRPQCDQLVGTKSIVCRFSSYDCGSVLSRCYKIHNQLITLPKPHQIKKMFYIVHSNCAEFLFIRSFSFLLWFVFNVNVLIRFLSLVKLLYDLGFIKGKMFL